MASRFTAYAVKNYQYIFDTYSEPFRQDISVELLEQSDQGVEWLSLNILSFETNSNRGKVEFVAMYRQQQDFYRLQEISDFVKQNGEWLYTTGTIDPDSGIFFPGRNDTCPCGSGKKFKKCCL
jgi:SEC-C motif-containing protein